MPSFFPVFFLSTMASVRRSSRLMLKNSGASVAPNASVIISGRPFSPFLNLDEPAKSHEYVQSMDVSFYWREKDYGDEVMENWYFTMRATNNFGHTHSICFWRNYVYFTADRIFFGYYNSRTSIYKKGDKAILCNNIFATKYEYTLSAPFDQVVAIMKAGLVDAQTKVHDSEVYTFPLGEIKVQWLYQHDPPNAHFVFV